MSPLCDTSVAAPALARARRGLGEVVGVDPLANALGDLGRGELRRVDEDHGELLASDPPNDVLAAHLILEDVCERGQNVVTGGVAEALIATAAGLLIAILTLIPYNYFSNRAERELEEIEYYGSRLELLLAEQEGKS